MDTRPRKPTGLLLLLLYRLTDTDHNGDTHYHVSPGGEVAGVTHLKVAVSIILRTVMADSSAMSMMRLPTART